MKGRCALGPHHHDPIVVYYSEVMSQTAELNVLTRCVLRQEAGDEATPKRVARADLRICGAGRAQDRTSLRMHLTTHVFIEPSAPVVQNSYRVGRLVLAEFTLSFFHFIYSFAAPSSLSVQQRAVAEPLLYCCSHSFLSFQQKSLSLVCCKTA